jgi:glucokinase
MHVLAGDIGGTRARFAIFELQAKHKTRLVHQEVLESQSFGSFEKALTKFLDGSAKEAISSKLKIAAATFGIAGPVVDQRIETTNLPWQIDGRKIAKKFSIPKVTLLNDLVAVGLGAIASPPSKLFEVRRGKPKTKGGNLAVIAAGTGLGEATFIWNEEGQNHIACATEGSHVEFGPQSEIEDLLLRKLRKEFFHVSYERIASGSTISMVYRFIVRDRKIRESKANADTFARAEDPNVAVVELAESGKSEAAMQAIDLWCEVYGAEAGNLVLKSLATSGIFICGGVSGRLANILKSGLPKRKDAVSPFIQGFLNKGRMRDIMEHVPIAVCTEPRAGLLGAAAHAAKSAS